MIYRTLIINSLVTVLMLGTAEASQTYFLCGSDEDGCSPNDYSACFCIPYDGLLASKPYCLNLDEVACIPLSQKKDCSSELIMKDQNTCLAVAFQSEPEPPCTLVNKQFCLDNRMHLCPEGGFLTSCTQ